MSMIHRQLLDLEEDETLAPSETDVNKCRTPQDLFKSAKFAQFVSIYNKHLIKEATQSGQYGTATLTAEEITEHSYWAKDAYEFFLHKLQVRAPVATIQRISKIAQEIIDRIRKAEEAHQAAEKSLFDANKSLSQPF